MILAAVKRSLPDWKNVLLAILAAILLILAFPDFEYWFLAWFALVPLMWAVEREKESLVRSFVVGWLFGTVFFFGTCWWLTFAPINYAGFPPWLAYSGMMFVAVAVRSFPALVAGIQAVLLRRFGSWGFLAAPFVWVFSEFLRYWLTGNNWNAVGYSQAFAGRSLDMAGYGGVLLTTFFVLVPGSFLIGAFCKLGKALKQEVREPDLRMSLADLQSSGRNFIKDLCLTGLYALLVLFCIAYPLYIWPPVAVQTGNEAATVIVIQPNVPMSSVDLTKLGQLRQRQIEMAEAALKMVNDQLTTDNRQLTTVILPESPMNFMYEDDREFQKFINDFARRNNVSVVFNSAEPDATNGQYFNSAVMVVPQGGQTGQCDKI